MCFYPIHPSLSPLHAPRPNPFPYAPTECPLVLFWVYTHLHLRTWGDQAVSLGSYPPFPAPARFHSARGWDTFLPKEKSKHPSHQLRTVWATITTRVARDARWRNSGTDSTETSDHFPFPLKAWPTKSKSFLTLLWSQEPDRSYGPVSIILLNEHSTEVPTTSLTPKD